MRFTWIQRTAGLLLALVAAFALALPPQGGCGHSAVPFCPIERLSVPSVPGMGAASVPTPFKIIIAVFALACAAAGRDPMPQGIRARFLWRRRYVEMELPRGVLWRDAFCPGAVPVLDP